MNSNFNSPIWLLRPRWRKVLADLWNNKVRTLLVVVSIAVGTFSVGLVSSAYLLLSSDVNREYLSVNPHAAVIFSDPFGDDMVNTVKQIDGVRQAQGRSAVARRVVVNEENKLPITVIAIPDVGKMDLDLLRPVNPDQIPVLQNHEILIENSSLTGLKVMPGDILQIELRGDRTRELRVAGIVNDLTVAPYTFTGQMTGYVNQDTLVWLGGRPDFNQMYITVQPDVKKQADVTRIAQSVGDKIEKSGLAVFRTTVTTPGKHYASDFIDGMGALLGFMGVLAIFLSGFLTVNTITSLLNQQIRQIGIMKSYGGQTGQLIRMYLALVMCFGVLALFIAVPLSAISAFLIAGKLAGFLNFMVDGFRIPALALFLQVFVALMVPAGAALVPVMNGTRISIRSAINDSRPGKSSGSTSWIDRIVERFKKLPRPLLLSLRNVFRRKGRLFLTLSTMVLGGCIFIAVFNMRASLNISIQESLGYFLSDVNVNFTRPYRQQEVEKLITDIPGVIGLEGWGAAAAQVLSIDENNSDEVIVSAPPSDSKMIRPVITSGRWLKPGDENAVVISNQLIKKRPDLKVGDVITVKIGGKKHSWTIIGICSIAGQIPVPLVYTTSEYLQQITGSVDTVSEIHVKTAPADLETQQRVAQTLEVTLKRENLALGKITTGHDMSSRLLVLINMMVIMLLTMAVLIAVVGGLGLMGTMSQNVFDRTREIGVMRAIGADNRAIQQMVIVEGVLIGLLSWVMALVLALPFSSLLEYAVGIPIVGGPLPVVLLSPDGPILWLVLVGGLSALASYLPARSASKLTIREVLAYE